MFGMNTYTYLAFLSEFLLPVSIWPSGQICTYVYSSQTIVHRLDQQACLVVLLCTVVVSTWFVSMCFDVFRCGQEFPWYLVYFIS